MSGSRKLTVAPIVLLVATLAGCGAEGGKGDAAVSASPSSTPKPVDQRPRVEGTWRVVFTPRDEDKGADERVSWTIVPKCPEGPCTARIKSSSGAQFNLRFDAAIGDYQRVRTYRSDCANQATEEVVFKNAYTTRSVATLEVVDVLTTPDGTRYAAELTGKDVSRSTLKKAAAGTCADASDAEIEDVRMVRTNLPDGRRDSDQIDATTPEPSVD